MDQNPQTALAKQYILNTNTSIFLTGKAGTGKTTFLKNLVKDIDKRYVIVAPTGVAAVNAGGVTIHSFFQLPPCPYLPDVKELVTEYQLPESNRQLRKEKRKIIASLDLLIIDEISMVRADLLDAIDMTLRRYRHSRRPFGGVQLLMIGDIQQLPPVVKDDEKAYLERVYSSPFFFASKALRNAPFITIELTKVYRQQDADFVDLLNRVRDNKFDANTLEKLNQRYQPDFTPKENENYIRLTTHNHQADAINSKKLKELKGKEYSFEAVVEGSFPDYSRATDTELHLKEGSQVMFVRNDSSSEKAYYNGKLGIIEGFDTEEGIISVKDSEGNHIQVQRERWENLSYVLNSQTNLIEEKVEGTFTQFPLKTAWAITIHKSQGLTFDKLIIDAGAAFAFGQVYVALSRCRSWEGLVLASKISSDCAFADPSVEQFLQQIPSEEDAKASLLIQKVNYFYEMVSELFDFSELFHLVERTKNIFQKNLKNLYPEQFEWISNFSLGSMIDTSNVMEKFQRQIKELQQYFGTDLESDYLHERIAKGAQYFRSTLSEWDKKLAPLYELGVDNKEVASDLKKIEESYLEVIRVKERCLALVEKDNRFSVSQYIQTRNEAVLDDKKSKKTPKLETKHTEFDLVKHPKLARRLSQWRKGIASDKNVPAYVIMTQKTLLSIADTLPLNGEELEKIKGLGKSKLQTYGHEILSVIEDYCHEEGIKFKSDELFQERKASSKSLSGWKESVEMVINGIPIEEIAQNRGISIEEVESHISKAVLEGIVDPYEVIDNEQLDEMVEYWMDSPRKSVKEAIKDFEGRFSKPMLEIGKYVAESL